MPEKLRKAPPSRVAASARCRIVVLSSPKGGTGKTTLAMNFLTLAAAEGRRVLGIDLDPQETLVKWARRREESAEKNPRLPMFDVLPAPVSLYRQALDAALTYDVAVIDMLPSVDHCLPAVHAVCEAAGLVLVPTRPTMNDLDSTLPWIRELSNLGFNVATCMNQAARREVFFEAARAQLNAAGTLCAVEVRHLSGAHVPAVEGLSASDFPKTKAASDFASVWEFVRRALDLAERAAA